MTTTIFSVQGHHPSAFSFLQLFLFETHCAGCEIPPTENTISHRASLELVGVVICTFLSQLHLSFKINGHKWRNVSLSQHALLKLCVASSVQQ